MRGMLCEAVRQAVCDSGCVCGRPCVRQAVRVPYNPPAIHKA